MKAVLGLLLSAVSLASAITSPERVSYDGYKAVRVAVGDDASRVTDLIDRMSLQVWKGIKKGRTHVDVVVAPDQLSEFEDATADLDTLIMHTDLGASIKEEANFEAFGQCQSNQLCDAVLICLSSWRGECNLVQLLPHLGRSFEIHQRSTHSVSRQHEGCDLWHDQRRSRYHWASSLWQIRRRCQAWYHLTLYCSCSRVDRHYGEC